MQMPLIVVEKEYRRLLSLWEIMNLYDVHALVYMMHEFILAQSALTLLKMTGSGASQPGGSELKKALFAFDFADSFFRNYNIGKCSQYLQTARDQWSRTATLDVSGAAEILYRLQIDILSELKAKAFLHVSEDRAEFVDNDSLFGEEVLKAFGSAKKDIREAGNCLAAECNTAAVFHLMRAAEVALRAIATDRQVTFANKPLDQQEWGTILGSLDGILRTMRLDDTKKWTNPAFKEAQVHFYSEAIQELRGFNEAWRRHVAHADVDAFYDHEDASNITRHVRNFMQKLATRISETKTMPFYWDTE